MKSNSSDYKLIKKAFEDTILSHCKVATHKIFRVKERSMGELSEPESDNLMLFHGTNICNAVGILEKGFIPSKGGLYGPGVYLTASPYTAYSYSLSKTDKVIKSTTLFSVFVNEILESEKLQVVNPRNQTTKSHFKRYITVGTPEKDSYQTYEKDSNGRRIRTSQEFFNEYDRCNHYVSHENFVIPRYFIQFFELS